MTKRTFFKSLMGAVAAVALAPEIAFGVRLKMPSAGEWYWFRDAHEIETGEWRRIDLDSYP